MLLKKDFVFSGKELSEYLKNNNYNDSDFGLDKLKHPFFLMIPKYYLGLIDWNDPNDPLYKMVVTSSLESNVKDYEIADPIGDKRHQPVPGIVHRYSDRCLLMLTNICAVHCRFCFRKNLLSSNTYDYKKSIEYIKEHNEIWEVILSGGDPFMLTNDFLKKVILNLREIKHVKIIRFHSRTPVVYPKRINEDFINILKMANPLVVVLHINHPKEITKEFITALDNLKSTGAMLLSQTVLLKGVNNNPKTLTELFKRLVEIGVKPYYLHHLDFAKGTDHFRISVEEGKRIYRKLNQISGHCIPEYVIDVPGGYGKIPVFWFNHVGKNKYKATDFAGRNIVYIDPAE